MATGSEGGRGWASSISCFAVLSAHPVHPHYLQCLGSSGEEGGRTCILYLFHSFSSLPTLDPSPNASPDAPPPPSRLSVLPPQEYYANTGALKRAAQSARGGAPVGCSIVEAYGKVRES